MSRSVRIVFFLFSLLSSTVSVIAQTFTSSNLPIIIINTSEQAIVDEPKITADMHVIYNPDGLRHNVDDSAFSYSGKIGIEIRGSSSQMFPKKQYGIELRSSSGDAVDTTLLGLPAENDWVLFAPYNDKSLMRDVLAYTLGGNLHRYAPRTRYCELVLNDEYQGIYVLIEKIKRGKNRVDINKLKADENDGDDVTGGYIIKIDKPTGGSGGWTSRYSPAERANAKIDFYIHYPDFEKATFKQRQYIKSYFDQLKMCCKVKPFAIRLTVMRALLTSIRLLTF